MHSSIFLSQWVVAADNATDALLLLCETHSSGSAEDVATAEELYKEARSAERAANAAWETSLGLPDLFSGTSR